MNLSWLTHSVLKEGATQSLINVPKKCKCDTKHHTSVRSPLVQTNKFIIEPRASVAIIIKAKLEMYGNINDY